MTGDFELTQDELREVARFVAEVAQGALPTFEEAHPGDPRPRIALDSAWAFVSGAPRTKRQRVASLDAHRAAKESSTEIARLAARSAGDAASAAYLHPIAQAGQVGHILRAAASVARIAELQAGDYPAAAARVIDEARQSATPTLIDVLRRYPVAPATKTRVSQLQAVLDASLRAAHSRTH